MNDNKIRGKTRKNRDDEIERRKNRDEVIERRINNEIE